MPLHESFPTCFFLVISQDRRALRRCSQSPDYIFPRLQAFIPVSINFKEYAADLISLNSDDYFVLIDRQTGFIFCTNSSRQLQFFTCKNFYICHKLCSLYHPEFGDWPRKVSEFTKFGKGQKLLGLESVRIGKCQNWKVSELESVRIGKCQNWKVSETVWIGGLERVRNYLGWKMSELK